MIRHQLNYRVCGVYLLDSQFVEDTPKFFQGVMTCMSAMLQLEIPHLNVLSKMDLCTSPENILRFLDSDTSLLLETANKSMAPKYANLNAALVRLIDEYSMVHFLPLNIKDEDSVEKILYEIDNALQYFEDQEVMIFSTNFMISPKNLKMTNMILIMNDSDIVDCHKEFNLWDFGRK